MYSVRALALSFSFAMSNATSRLRNKLVDTSTNKERVGKVFKFYSILTTISIRPLYFWNELCTTIAQLDIISILLKYGKELSDSSILVKITSAREEPL